MWKSEKENTKIQDYIENIKTLENMVSDLQQRLNHYEGSFDNMNNNLHRYEENGQMSSNQITDIYERLQGFYDKEKVNTNKMLQLEKELNSYREEIKAHRIDVKVLEQRIEELQSNTGSSKSRSTLKKKRHLEFANQQQFLEQNERPNPETIQRVLSQERPAKKSDNNRKVKQLTKNRFVSDSELVTRYYPKDHTPTRMSAFNPLKYS
jgi:chromosome segregation ATPase